MALTVLIRVGHIVYVDNAALFRNTKLQYSIASRILNI